MCKIIFRLYDFIYFLSLNELKYIKHLLCPQNVFPHPISSTTLSIYYELFKEYISKPRHTIKSSFSSCPHIIFLNVLLSPGHLMFSGTYWSHLKCWHVGQHLSFSVLSCSIIAFVLLLFVCSYLCHVSPAPYDLNWASPSLVPPRQ